MVQDENGSLQCEELELLLGMAVHACNANYLGGGGRRIMSSGPTLANLVRPYLELHTKGLGCCTNGRMLL
jgi:hypothetical protein